MDEFADTVAVAKPVVYVTVGELVDTHRVRAAAGRWAAGGALGSRGAGSAPRLRPRRLQLLLEHQDWVAPDPRDPLHELLQDLGELPTVADLVGACGPAGSGGALCPRVSAQAGTCARRRVTHSPSLCPSVRGAHRDTG